MAHAAGGPIAWPAFDLEIPTTSPAAVAVPHAATWTTLARENRAALNAVTTEIGGMPLAELRRTARAEALPLAVAYTRGLGVAAPSGTADLLLGTGHQPLLVHPGIWVKYLVLARLVPPGQVGLNLIVDSDAVDEVTAEVPYHDGQWRRARVPLARGGPSTPIEVIPAPRAHEWRQFVETVDRHLATVADGAMTAGWVRARQFIPPASEHGLAGALSSLRRSLEGPRPYLDLPVSHLVRTPAFRRFAFAILRDAGRFAVIHNACLDAYREHYGVRTSAQPFPDLDIDDHRIETPFWYVAGGQRWPLFVEPLGRRLMAGDRDVGPVPDDPEEASFADAPIRPRALTLTAFARVVLTDLFIHGIGGGRYDRATDAVVRAFFGIAPPAYATATATLFLPFEADSTIDAERQRLHRLLLDLQHNPDRFLGADGAHRALVEEKWALIRRLEQGDHLTRRERRAATQRIRELNTILQVEVADKVVAAQRSLARLDRRQADTEVTAYRGYPFLFHRVEAVDALVDLLLDMSPERGA
ncbi:MAG: hypothetical protein QN178_07305 [Armatimonadota bacterium]|nr:hypothetical protein [Armatimonadota bacterium]